MGRKTIPSSVMLALRSEVGFGCPVKDCGNPYLEYHHFDPPVSVRAHNEPQGMIALCAQHHKKADGGAYTNEQLHALKKDRAHAESVKGSLDWLRHELIAVVGGNYYHETPRIIVIDGVEVVSLKRDEEGYLRLSVNMLSLVAEERISIDRNSWGGVGAPTDLRCPPQGKELEVKYKNGDYLYLRFFEIESADEAVKKYHNDGFLDDGINYPVTIVEVNLKVGGTNIDFSPDGSEFGGYSVSGGFSSHCGGGVYIEGTGLGWKQNPDEAPNSTSLQKNNRVIKVDFRKKR
ncbi:HNH endonuclease [Pseudomonas brassicacearum]|uniref:HNH endonuclease n=1 Tax=Pseudomonas brassicacearum TaxID=930166 RepID=UPI0009B92D42|nr:HNH endonuclease [Pseudomonas brassicacearum]